MYGSSRHFSVPTLGNCIVSTCLEDNGESYVVVTTGIGTPEEKSSRLDIPVGILDSFVTSVVNLGAEYHGLPPLDEDEDEDLG